MVCANGTTLDGHVLDASRANPVTGSAGAAANRRGIIAMTGAMASFVVNDALVKYVSQSLPGAQLIFIRGLFATILLLGIAWAMGLLRGPGARVREVLHRPVLVRSALDAAATLVYLTALFHLPLANATAINMATPLFIALLAVLWMGERIGLVRWLAIVAGFVGVLFIVQPKADGFNGYALLCLLGTLLHAARDLYTRKIHVDMPSILITVGTAVSVTLLAGLISLIEGWRACSVMQLGLLAAASVFLSGGYFLLIRAMRAGEISLIAPFRYTGLLIALGIGFVVWNEVPNAIAWGGIALLVGAGLYMLLAERSRPRADLEAAPE
jgi:drug/metabolite transporter (DMT)-like permease